VVLDYFSFKLIDVREQRSKRKKREVGKERRNEQKRGGRKEEEKKYFQFKTNTLQNKNCKIANCLKGISI
jgi:hypothetical protein